jgi:ABC-2 type transport system ATP-binding protein
VTELKDGLTALEVASLTGRDIRRELAAAVVGRGWGLLELRPMRMSLEDVFLTLTTVEADAPAATTEAA